MQNIINMQSSWKIKRKVISYSTLSILLKLIKNIIILFMSLLNDKILNKMKTNKSTNDPIFVEINIPLKAKNEWELLYLKTDINRLKLFSINIVHSTNTNNSKCVFFFKFSRKKLFWTR